MYKNKENGQVYLLRSGHLSRLEGYEVYLVSVNSQQLSGVQEQSTGAGKSSSGVLFVL